MSETAVLPTALEALRVRITRVFPEQIRRCVDQLDDGQLWWRPNEASNAVANLVIHLTGSLDHFLNRGIGGFAYERDRPAEFAARGAMPKEELRARFDDMIARAEQTFAALTPERLGDPSPEPQLNSIVFEDLLNVALHIANHAGQIVWITKMLTESAGHRELWMKTHRDGGAWKPV